jgi:uncharacterized protein (TIGR03435 family)
MTRSTVDNLSFGRKLLLAAFGISAIAGPVMLGLLSTPRIRAQSLQQTAAPLPTFDVASVKRTRLVARSGGEGESRASIIVTNGNLIIRNCNLRDCIEWAYRVKNYQILGPGWLNTEKYDISAKADGLVPEDQLRLMFQRLLAERFHLVLHHEPRPSPVYALLVGRNGPKMHESEADSSSVKFAPPGLRLIFQKEPLSQLADTLSTLAFMDRPVVDMTGRGGIYDFTLDLRELMESGKSPMAVTVDQKGSGDLTGAVGPSIFTVLGEQLGLRLEPRKAPLDVLIVDGAMRTPTEN